MKKLVKSLSVFVVLFVLAFVVVANVKAAPVLKVEGAQIRTSGNEGIRFVAELDTLEGVTERGFLVAKGEYSVEEMKEVGTKYTVSGKTYNMFSAVIYGIPEESYTQDLTVVAYYVTDGDPVYADASVTRNLTEVAIEAYNNGDTTSEIVNKARAAGKTTFNFNLKVNESAYLVPEYEFYLTRYNSISSSWGDISSIISKGNGCTTINYSRICVAKQENGLYKVVAVIPSTVSSATVTVDYDYMIQTHGTPSFDYELVAGNVIKKIISSEDPTDYYVSFGALKDGTVMTFKFSTNPEILLGNELHLAVGSKLPTVTKDHYDFMGWHTDEALQSEIVTVKGAESSLYAEWKPVTYTITYVLNGGESKVNLNDEYTYESAEIVLPTADQMLLENAEFRGWYDNELFNGEAITSIKAGSYGDLTLYAAWQTEAINTVELSTNDTAAITKLTPTIVVKSDFNIGKFDVNGQVYVAGTNAFTSIKNALESNSVINSTEPVNIYVFAGTYGDQFTIASDNVTIYGPNYNKTLADVRGDEAIISNYIYVSANNTTINGIKFTGLQINFAKAIKGIEISSIYSTSNGTAGLGGRNAVVGTNYDVTDFVLKNNNFVIANGGAGKNVIATYGVVTNFTAIDNIFSNEGDIGGNSEAIRLNNGASGVVEINGNTFLWSSANFTFMIGYKTASTTNTCTEINVKNNVFKGGTVTASGLQIVSIPAITVNIENNSFSKIAGNTFNFEASNVNATINIIYNYFDADTSFKLTTTGSGKIITNYNCYDAEITTTTGYNPNLANETTYSTEAEVKDAYNKR